MWQEGGGEEKVGGERAPSLVAQTQRNLQKLVGRSIGQALAGTRSMQLAGKFNH